MQVTVDPSVVIVVFEQQVARRRVGALALLDGPGVDVVRIHAKQRHGAEVLAVQHRGHPVAFQMLAEELGHLDQVSQQGTEPGLAQQPQTGQRGQHAAATAAGLQREQPGMMLARLEQVGHVGAAPDELLQVGLVTNQEEAGHVRREPGLVEVEPHRVRQSEMPDPVQRPRERPHRPGSEPERVLLEAVAGEHRPRPADDRIRMHVWAVVELEPRDQPVAHRHDRLQIVHPERVRRAHHRDEGRDPPAVPQRALRRLGEQVQVDVVGGLARHLDHVPFAQTKPAGHVQPRVVALRGRQHHGVAAHPRLHRARQRFFEPDLDAVEVGAGPAEREQPAGHLRVVPDEIRRHRRHPDLRLHDPAGRVVGDEIGVVNRRQQHPDDAGDRGATDHVRLRPRMSPDREPAELVDQLRGDLLDRGRVAGHPRLPRRGVIQGPGAAKHRDLRFQGVDLVDRAHQGKHEVGIVNPVGHRLREGQADLRE